MIAKLEMTKLSTTQQNKDKTNPFRPWVILDMSRFGRVISAWVVSAYFDGSFRPDIPCPPLCYNVNETAHNDNFSFMASHTSLCSAAVSKESYTVEKGDDYTQTHINNSNLFRAFAASKYMYSVGKRTKL